MTRSTLKLLRELIFRNIIGKERIPGDVFYGLRAADGVLRQRICYTVSGFRRVLFFYAYATLLQSIEASVAYGNTGEAKPK